jgi:pyrimidine operon attenuation protein/uracil phosphoribosyltransferase
MPENEPTTSTPELVRDEQPVGDFFASKLADRIRIDNWRRRLTYIRQEILEIAEQGSQQGFVGLKRETVKLAKSIERLEALLGLKTIQ